jgi:hypothetical protein
MFSLFTKRENKECPDALFYGNSITKREKIEFSHALFYGNSITKRENIECPDALFYGSKSKASGHSIFSLFVLELS